MVNLPKRWAPLPLRIMLGVGFVYHGWPKLFSSQGHQGFVGMLGALGVPAPEMTAWLVGLAEIVGGVALIAGAFVAVASAILIADMLVAMLTVHARHGFNFINITGMDKQGPVFGMPGAEVNLLYIAGLLALVMAGTGTWSVETLLQDRKRIREP